MVALGCTLILASCTADAREPVGIAAPTGGGGTSGGSGGDTSSGGSAAEALVGSWQNDFVIGMSGDVQRITTTWTFGANGRCLKSVRTFSILDGSTFTTNRGCGYSINNGRVLIGFDNDPLSVAFSLSFRQMDVILLGGIQFVRL